MRLGNGTIFQRRKGLPVSDGKNRAVKGFSEEFKWATGICYLLNNLKVKNRMPSRLAITKMKAILIIDLIIVTIAAGTYLYLQSQGEFTSIALKPATFIVTDLIINPN